MTATQVWACRGEHYRDVGSVMATAEHPAPFEDEPELYHVEVNVGLSYSNLPGQIDPCPGITVALMGPKFDVSTTMRSAEARRHAQLVLEACDRLDAAEAEGNAHVSDEPAPSAEAIPAHLAVSAALETATE